MIVVDTSVWIDYLNGIDNKKTTLLDTLIQQNIILMGDLIYIEILQGIKNQKLFDATKKQLNNFSFEVMSNQQIAIQSAQNYRYLREKGFTVRKTIDVLIATFCIYHNHVLLHNDKDFDPIEKHLGLRTIG